MGCEIACLAFEFPCLYNLFIIKCIENEDGKNEHNYMFEYRSNCQTLPKRLNVLVCIVTYFL